jgi:hypothetical protein
MNLDIDNPPIAPTQAVHFVGQRINRVRFFQQSLIPIFASCTLGDQVLKIIIN